MYDCGSQRLRFSAEVSILQLSILNEPDPSSLVVAKTSVNFGIAYHFLAFVEGIRSMNMPMTK